MYEAAGVTPDKTVIPYCSTGVRSAATYFTLTLLGYPRVALYTGSWDEWSRHPELRISIGQKP
jgi:thiosulfate/3-mercaptopyruvate sulfurtransferase